MRLKIRFRKECGFDSHRPHHHFADGRWTTERPRLREDERERVFWKLDYYDRDLRFASDDAANSAVTRRVLTIMLSDEY